MPSTAKINPREKNVLLEFMKLNPRDIRIILGFRPTTKF